MVWLNISTTTAVISFHSLIHEPKHAPPINLPTQHTMRTQTSGLGTKNKEQETSTITTHTSFFYFFSSLSFHAYLVSWACLSSHDSLWSDILPERSTDTHAHRISIQIWPALFIMGLGSVHFLTSIQFWLVNYLLTLEKNVGRLE